MFYSKIIKKEEDKKIKEILLAYTKWLDKRGFFKEELQCDFSHQIETFLEINNGNNYNIIQNNDRRR